MSQNDVFNCYWLLICPWKMNRFSKTLFFLTAKRAGGGGRYLVYFSDGDVPFFRVSFSPIFSRMAYQNRAVFLAPVVKKCQEGKFC